MCNLCGDSGLLTIPDAIKIMARGVDVGNQPVSMEDQKHYTCICGAGRQQREQAALIRRRKRGNVVVNR